MIDKSGYSIPAQSFGNYADPISASTTLASQGYGGNLTANVQASNPSSQPNIPVVFFWLVIALVIIEVVTRHEKLGNTETEHIKIGARSWFVVGLLSLTFLLAARVAAVKATWMPQGLRNAILSV